MALEENAQQKIDSYLSQLRELLRGVSEGDVREIVDELRSHLRDRCGAGTTAEVDLALNALGSPKQLAREYLTDNVLAHAEVSRSPVRIVRGLFQLASMSVASVFVLLASLVGYFVAGAFLVVALLKPFYPHTAGLWTYRDGTGDLGISLRMGFGGGTGVGNDLLGWWILPVGLVAAGILVWTTTWMALGFMRKYRRTRSQARELMRATVEGS